jgi:hypothetical protein
MLHPLAAAVAIVLLAANQALPPADAPSGDLPPGPAPNTAIVGGHHIQPRANASEGAPDANGISKRDADDVDRLYQELMRQTAPDTGKGRSSTTPP